jgi:succinyl-CoA synthetase beta subunit/citryl-CoA synthetase large subunit
MGGNPTAEKVAALTRLLLAKPGVEKLAVIMNVVNNTRADIIAAGVVAGIEAAGLRASEVVAVFRVPGSWEAEARQKMATVGVEALGREVSLDLAARLAVQRTGSDAA